jgi:hypothetical protein
MNTLKVTLLDHLHTPAQNGGCPDFVSSNGTSATFLFINSDDAPSDAVGLPPAFMISVVVSTAASSTTRPFVMSQKTSFAAPRVNEAHFADDMLSVQYCSAVMSTPREGLLSVWGTKVGYSETIRVTTGWRRSNQLQGFRAIRLT